MHLKKSIFLLIVFITFLGLVSVAGSASVIMTVTSDTPDSVTVHDCSDRDVTIKQPVERIVVLDAHQQMTSALKALGLYDKIVGIDTDAAKETSLFDNIGNKTVVGTNKEPDIEKILSLKPDVVFDVGSYPGDELKKMQDAGLTVVSISLFPTPNEGFKPTIENTRVLGSIVGAKDKANEFADWKEKYLNIIKDRVSNLSDSEKPSSLYTYKWKDNSIFGAGNKNRFHYVLDYVGSSDINKDVDSDWAEIDLEDVIKENPSYIIFEEMNHKSGYGVTDPSTMVSSIESIKEIPGFENVDAVKNNKIYGLPMSVLSGDTWLGAIYLAPVFHPDLFKDFDPVKIHQEYLDKFMGVKQNVSDDVFLYPKLNN
jgi:iron complex transport system substrate-binding protein